MLLQGRIQRPQNVIQLLLSRRKARSIVAFCFLSGVFITILRSYILSSVEVPRSTYKFSDWVNELEPFTSSIGGFKSPGEATVDTQEISDPLIAWLESTGITTDRIPLISIADSKYIQALRNLRSRLDKWDRGSDLVVICLDTACTEEADFKGYGGYISQNGKIMESVALIKFQINLALSKNGYNFVFFDGDVFFTGSRDPFEDMLPLSNNTWDVQFQYDRPWPNPRINIGWYLSKATPATIDFYERSYKFWSELDHGWDQGAMNKIKENMEDGEQSLKVHRLWNPQFQNWMLNDWQGLFGNETAAAAFIQDASIIHFTCVEQDLKTYFGSNFGGFGDVDGYYSNPPPLLAVANIFGLSKSIHSQLAFAARLANATGRTLIWPDTVGLVQNRSKSAEFEYRSKFPSIRTVSYASAQELGLKTVEARYLINRNAQADAVPLLEVVLNATEFVVDGGPAALEDKVLSLDDQVIAVIDFSSFAPGRWLREFADIDPTVNGSSAILANQSSDIEKSFQETFAETGMKNYSSPFLEQLRQCCNVNDKLPGCLYVCECGDETKCKRSTC